MRVVFYCSHIELEKIEKRLTPLVQELDRTGVSSEILDYHFSYGDALKEQLFTKVELADAVVLVSSPDLWDSQFIFFQIIPLIQKEALVVVINYRSVEIPDIFEKKMIIPEKKAVLGRSNQDAIWLSVRTKLHSLILERNGEQMTQPNSFREENRKHAKRARENNHAQQTNRDGSTLVDKIASAKAGAIEKLKNAQMFNRQTSAVVFGPFSLSYRFDDTGDIRYWFINHVGSTYSVETFKQYWNASSSFWESQLEIIPEPVYDVLSQLGIPTVRFMNNWLSILGPVPLALFEYLHAQEGYIVYPIFQTGHYGLEAYLYAKDPDDDF